MWDESDFGSDRHLGKVEQTMKYTDIPRERWHEERASIANNRTAWSKRARRWRRDARREACRDEWIHRHAADGPRAILEITAFRYNIAQGRMIVSAEGISLCKYGGTH
eukprot:5906584-Pyramimonas_sp.AAC.1